MKKRHGRTDLGDESEDDTPLASLGSRAAPRVSPSSSTQGKPTQTQATQGTQATQDDSEEEEEEGATEGGAKSNVTRVKFKVTKKGEDAFAKLDQSVQEEIVSSATRTIMLMGMSDSRIVLRSSVKKSIAVEDRSIVDIVLRNAHERVMDIFGMNLCYLTKASSVRTDDAVRRDDTSSYLLMNLLAHPDHKRDLVSDVDCHVQGLLMAVLGLLFLHHRGGLSVDDLLVRLTQIDPAVNERFTGGVKGMIDEFTSQKYLKKFEGKGLEIGPRAVAEVGLAPLASFVAKLSGVSEPTEQELKAWIAESSTSNK